VIVRDHWKFDTSLQMFVDEPREPDMARLRFLRWLAECGRLESSAISKSTGEYAETNQKN
jgi:hypothetical protein